MLALTIRGKATYAQVMRLAWIIATASVSTACRFDLPAASADAESDASDAPSRVCYGAANGIVKPCFDLAPTGDVTLDAAINTTIEPSCSVVVLDVPAGLCVVAGANITVPAGVTVAVGGTRPLVLVATGTISVDGNLDAASRHAPSAPYDTFQIGAGANPTGGCNAPGVPGASGGAAGGSFMVLGGAGGGGIGSTGGSPGAAQSTLALRGGCPGQSALGTLGGRGGRGGGAVYLIANSINIPGTINASGEGGGPGLTGASSGGGGGGAGGLIGLDAATINNTGLVLANGGGGGEGSGGGTSGLPGADPTGVAPATGGIGGSAGGNGGVGGAGGTGGGNNTGSNGQSTANDGGGAGGGGTGVIKVYRSVLGGTHSPSPTP